MHDANHKKKKRTPMGVYKRRLIVGSNGFKVFKYFKTGALLNEIFLGSFSGNFFFSTSFHLN
jgi:hypothetical protein